MSSCDKMALVKERLRLYPAAWFIEMRFHSNSSPVQQAISFALDAQVA